MSNLLGNLPHPITTSPSHQSISTAAVRFSTFALIWSRVSMCGVPVYSTLIFIDVCMGEGRTASWRNLWNEYRAGQGGVSVYLRLHIVYSTLTYIDVCVGEGRTASWRNLWNVCRVGRGGVSDYLTLHRLFYLNLRWCLHGGGSGGVSDYLSLHRLFYLNLHWCLHGGG